jgi:hypothetical protein
MLIEEFIITVFCWVASNHALGWLPPGRALCGWTNPVTRKLLVHTIGVWLNLQQGREPLERDGLVTA